MRFIWSALVLVLPPACGWTFAQQAPFKGFVSVPSPLSAENPLHRLVPRTAPVVGKAFTDARFGTTLMRVTQEKGVRHEYSRHDPFSKDQSLILLRHPASGEQRVYRTKSLPYDAPANLVRMIDLEEPRWDAHEPTTLWGFEEFRIIRLDVQSGKTAVVKDFAKDSKIGPILKREPDLYRITTRDEGEPSLDKRYWALIVQGSKEDYRARYLICWDRREDRIVGFYPVSKNESRIDWVGMSPLGNWVLIGGDWDNGGRLQGLTLADRGLTRFHRLDHATSHADVGLDSQGGEVIVMQNSRTDHIDLIPLDPKTKPTENDRYEGTNRVPLIRLFYSDSSPIGLKSGVHISCNTPGYCVISTTTPPNEKEQNWLDRTILLVKLDRARPKVFYLAKVHNTTKTYWEETHATMTSDGSKIIWASNWGQNMGQDRTFLMLLEMPQEWRALAR